MVVVMQGGASEEQIQTVIDRLVSLGFDIHRSTGASQDTVGRGSLITSRITIFRKSLPCSARFRIWSS